jgi:hypothetical protein
LFSWRSKEGKGDGFGAMSNRYVLGDMVDGQLVVAVDREEAMNNGKKVKRLGKSI